jgi:hypothetical protein
LELATTKAVANEKEAIDFENNLNKKQKIQHNEKKLTRQLLGKPFKMGFSH